MPPGFLDQEPSRTVWCGFLCAQKFVKVLRDLYKLLVIEYRERRSSFREEKKTMLAPCVCRTEAEIRRLMERHADELVKEKQEVRMAFTVPDPLVCLIRGYEPHDAGHEYADALFVDPVGGEGVYILRPQQITYVEVLPTRCLVDARALQESEEIEHAVGLEHDHA